MFATRERLDAFRQGMQTHGYEAAGIAYGDFTFEGGLRAAQSLLAGTPRPDALLCANDAMALGALTAARDLGGLRLPQDVAVIGFDGQTIYQEPPVHARLDEGRAIGRVASSPSPSPSARASTRSSSPWRRAPRSTRTRTASP